MVLQNDIQGSRLYHGTYLKNYCGTTKNVLMASYLINVLTSGVQYTKFSYHNIGTIFIMIRYISRYATVV